MTAPASNPGTGQNDASTTVGIGGATSGQAGATPTHETQQETGGSGGAQLTHSTGEIDAPPGKPSGTPQAAPAAEAEAEADTQAHDSALQSGARGSLDTRARQAGGTGTGLGTPETGANQSEQDLPPAR